MHRIVLTGASGTLGSNFVRLVGSREDVRVLALVRSEALELSAWPSVSVAEVDFYDTCSLHTLIEAFRPTCILHCAATGMIFPRPRWFDLIRFNVIVSMGLCECAARIPGCQYIYVSTGLAYREQGRPLREDDPLDSMHPYGASKAAADHIVRAAAEEFSVPLTIFRPFSFTGLGDDRTRLFGTLLAAAQTGEPMLLTEGTQIRDHCSARDIAEALLASIDQRPVSPDALPRIFNIGSGRLISLRALVETVVEELGLRVDLRFGARQFSRLEPRHLVADTSVIRSEFGWEPRHNVAHAVWELARASFSSLRLREPLEEL
jgi:nucleoside-diphosphate-sugar epimerase